MVSAQYLESLDAHAQQLAIRQRDEADGAWSRVDKCHLTKDGRRVDFLKGPLSARQDDPHDAFGKKI